MASTRRALNGVPELRAALEALGTEVATKIGVAANRRAAKRLLDMLDAVAPEAPEGAQQSPSSKAYGKLRVNLKLRRVKGRTAGRIIHRVDTGNAFWGMFYELGTAKQRARPWMRPAAENLSGELADIQLQELRAGIERAARRLARLSAHKK